MDLLFTLATILFLFAVIFAANKVHSREWEPRILDSMLYIVIGAVAFFTLLNLSAVFFPMPVVEGVETPPLPDVGLALIVGTLTIASMIVSVLLLRSNAARLWVSRVIAEPTSYDPDSPLHTAAVVLALAMVAYLMLGFLAQGGTEGIAANLEDTGISGAEVLLTALLWVLAAALGVGYGLRRDAVAMFERLGLRRISARHVLLAGAVGFGMWLLSIVFSIVWLTLTDPEVFSQQNLAAEQLGRSVNTVLLVLLLSLGPAIGEEIFIRGALQPVFGIMLTSVFFTLLHTQYLFAPSMLIIFAASFAFAVLRFRYGTTAAIVAHFVYNFVPLILNFLVLNSTGGS